MPDEPRGSCRDKIPGTGEFADAVTEMVQPFVVLDSDERLITYNRAYADLHRNPDGSSALRPGLTFEELTEWRLRTGFFAGVVEARGTVAAFFKQKGEVTYQLSDGRWMLVERTRLADGRNIGLWIDITPVKRVEAQLRETGDDLRRSEEQLSRAQRIAHIGSDERDFDTGQVRWSDETYAIFGVTRDNFVVTRENLVALIHPDDRDAMKASFVNGAADLAPAAQEFRITRPDGAERIIARETEVIFDAQGRPQRRIGTLQDVTERRAQEALERALQRALRTAKEQAERAAEALEAANGDLERRVEERTRQLTMAQEELLKKERLSTIGQLTATVAHELRNPLSAIKNTVFALKEVTAGNGPGAARLVSRMERSLDRCNQIIAELLDYSRMRKLQCEAQCLDAWLGEVLDEQDVPPHLAVTRDLSAGDAFVNLDPERFRRVIINLFDNAAQALKEAAERCPEPAIVVRTRRDDGHIEIVVEDNGPGIPQETLARIFEPLFSTKSFGTGLGLPMVKQIIAQHDGDIEITSAPGTGTRARIRLPLFAKSAAA